MAASGLRRILATLDAPIGDHAGQPVVFSPSTAWCSIVPLPPSAFDETKTTHQVEMPYHSQVTFNTRIRYTDKNSVVHNLFVRGIQNVEAADRDLVLLCEEVLTP